MQGYEDEAKKSWKEAYAIFKELGLAKGNPQIAEVMRNLLDDEDIGPDGGYVGFGNGPSATTGGKSMFDMISDKVKNVANTAMKNAAGNRGSQLL